MNPPKTTTTPRENPHLANEPVLVHRPPLLAARRPRRLRPHLLDILEHHVAVPVEGLDARQQLAVVADRDEHLRVRPHRRLEDRERAGGELVLLELGDLVLAGKRLGMFLQRRGGRECPGVAGGRGRVRELVSRLREEFSAVLVSGWTQGGRGWGWGVLDLGVGHGCGIGSERDGSELVPRDGRGRLDHEAEVDAVAMLKSLGRKRPAP